MHDEDHAHHGERHDRPTPQAALLLPGTQRLDRRRMSSLWRVSGRRSTCSRGQRQHRSPLDSRAANTLLPAPRNKFFALNLAPPVEQVPAAETSSPPQARTILVEVPRGAGVVSVHWPLEDAASCAAWLSDCLR